MVDNGLGWNLFLFEGVIVSLKFKWYFPFVKPISHFQSYIGSPPLSGVPPEIDNNLKLNTPQLHQTWACQPPFRRVFPLKSRTHLMIVCFNGRYITQKINLNQLLYKLLVYFLLALQMEYGGLNLALLG